MAARIQREPTPVVLSRDSLFTVNYRVRSSDLHPDGDRLVIVRGVFADASDPEGAPIAPEQFFVVTNWFEELRQRAGN